MTEKEMLDTLELIFNHIASNYSKENYQNVFEMVYNIYGFLTYDLGYHFSNSSEYIKNGEFYF